MKSNAFAGYHPLVNFLWFALVLVYAMIFRHPICLGLSLVCAFAYSIRLRGAKTARFNFAFLLPMLLVCALLNPAFNHEGVTVLTYLPSGNPLTLESIVYGLVAGTMLATVIAWFNCYNTVMTSDKFIYLFGRVIPALSLILSMALRFVPRFAAQAKIIANAQRCLGRDISQGNLPQRARHGLTILSILVTWALENAIETADSMRSRGYGLPGRSAFAIFRWEGRDKRALLVILLLGGYVLAGSLSGAVDYRYFPSFSMAELGVFSVSVLLAYAALCAAPLYIEMKEDRRWKRI